MIVLDTKKFDEIGVEDGSVHIELRRIGLLSHAL
jgi:hypothetical protein